jgi:hypothetical protein
MGECESGENPVDGSDETVLKAAYWRSGTVNERLSGAFRGADYGLAAVLLAGLAPAHDCPPEADEAACRLMLAAIRVSKGDLARLQLWVDAGRIDPRDLIAAAEYPRELELGSAQAREEDLRDYLAWVQGALGA